MSPALLPFSNRRSFLIPKRTPYLQSYLSPPAPLSLAHRPAFDLRGESREFVTQFSLFSRFFPRHDASLFLTRSRKYFSPGVSNQDFLLMEVTRFSPFPDRKAATKRPLRSSNPAFSGKTLKECLNPDPSCSLTRVEERPSTLSRVRKFQDARLRKKPGNFTFFRTQSVSTGPKP